MNWTALNCASLNSRNLIFNSIGCVMASGWSCGERYLAVFKSCGECYLAVFKLWWSSLPEVKLNFNYIHRKSILMHIFKR